MNHTEAARKLYNILHDDRFSWTPESVGAFNTALEALANSSENPNNSPTQMSGTYDAVRRNAIIRTLNTMDRYIANELTLCDTDRKFPKNEVFVVDDVYEEIVEHLPSVQVIEKKLPAEKTGSWIRVSADRYIRKSDYIFECSECGEQVVGTPNYCSNCGAKMEVHNGDH